MNHNQREARKREAMRRVVSGRMVAVTAPGRKERKIRLQS